MSDAQIRRQSGSLAVTILAWLLGLMFVVAGGAKLAGTESLVQMFQAWGYPVWFMQVVGVMEVVGGIAILSPFSRLAGAVILSLVMIGAAGTHALFAQWAAFVVPVVVFALLIWMIQRTAWNYQRAQLATRGDRIHHPAA